MTKHFVHNAMATQFEAWLIGLDGAHLEAVAHQAWQEIDRLELLMSRFDSAAEIARVNREAKERPVRVEIELFRILEDCERWRRRTHGYFNVCYDVGGKADTMILDPVKRTVQLVEDAEIDLGAYGKGYALDLIADLVKSFGVHAGCLHGGTSSVYAWGVKENGDQWGVDVTVPHYREIVSEQLTLDRQGFSYSATTESPGSKSDIVNPVCKSVDDSEHACWVVAKTALEAEVLTTAAIAAGGLNVLPVNMDIKKGWL